MLREVHTWPGPKVPREPPLFPERDRVNGEEQVTCVCWASLSAYYLSHLPSVSLLLALTLALSLSCSMVLSHACTRSLLSHLPSHSLSSLENQQVAVGHSLANRQVAPDGQVECFFAISPNSAPPSISALISKIYSQQNFNP